MTAGKKGSVGISARSTKVTVNGKPVRRTSLKPGMTCDVTYHGNGSQASVIACK